MKKVKIEFGWRLWSLIVCALILIGVAGFSYATNSGNPAIMGHTADEISGLNNAAATAPAGNAIAEYGTVKSDGTKLAGSSGWTVLRNSQGQYQLNLSAGNYIVIVSKSINTYLYTVMALHSTTTGYFNNNVANNVQTYGTDADIRADLTWSFYAIKVS